MSESILEASQKAKKNGFFGFFKRKSTFIFLGLILIIAGGSWFYFNDKEEKETKVSAPKELTVKKGNLQIAIESDGKVVAEDGVKLSFSVNSDTLEVKELFVKEGDSIKKGDKIASVKTYDLEYDLNRAYAGYQSALASYNEKIAGATDDEIARAKASIEQAEISLEQSKISLEKTKTAAREKIANAEKAIETAKEELDKNKSIEDSEDVLDAYKDIVDTVKSVSITLESILPDSDEIIGVDNTSINDVFENNLGVKDSSTYAFAKNTYSIARNNKEELDDLAVFLSVEDSYFEIDSVVEKTVNVLSDTENHLFAMQKMLSASIVSTSLSQTQLDSFKATINSNRSSINTKIFALDADLENLKDAKDGLDDYLSDYNDAFEDLEIAKEEVKQDIANSEASLVSRELSLRNEEQNYNELLAPLTESELASARSSLTTAAINVDKAKNDLSRAILESPIDGEVALLNYKAGDIILNDDTGPVVEIINNDTLFIEVNIEEADISKLKVGQKAYATFDALNELRLEGEISFISLTSKTNNNGIVTYLVRVIFENPETAQVREGMTAFVDFVIAGVSDVLQIPVDAVRNVNDKPSAQLKSGEWIPVVTGFTDGKHVEVISGLNAGDIVLY
ncbi:HlyD family efflux transporter periplasmic adaptor subunit [Candidatus Parcubacteria bacterium]|nr:HlyD family efflux transporter periplasmic adaptor subunit [Candidatus Parcubacteria bacterium]